MSIIKRYATEDYVESEIDKAIENKTSEIYVGSNEPTDPNVDIWINPDGEPNYPGGTASEGVYELIETIVTDEEIAIERTQEPDGTPYNFSAISIRVKKNEGVALIGALSMSALVANNRYIALYLPETKSTAEQWGYAEIRQYKGFWERERAAEWSIYNSTATPMLVKIPMYDMKVLENDGINTLRGVAVQAGLTIEIWGVRQNA